MAASLPGTIAKSILADYIDNKKVRAGDRLPSVRELKDRYMTTNTTICAALTILENKGLVQKIHGKGNFVTEPEEQRLPGRNKIIGAILPHPAGNDMVARMQGGVEKCAREYDYQMMVAISDNNYDEEHADVLRLRDAGCRGIVLCPIPRLRHQLRADYLARECLDFPIVLIDMAFPEQKRSLVVLDNQKAGYEITQLLIDQGHKRIAFMDWQVPEGELMSRSVRDRYFGYLRAMKNAGLEPYPEDHWLMTYPGYETEVFLDLKLKLQEWKASRQRPTALVALDDNWAIITLQMAREFGIAIPGDIDIVGFDNCPTLGLTQPTFPTTSPSFELVGETAVHLLMQHINGEIDAPVHYMLPAPVTRRDQNFRLNHLSA